MTSDQGMLDGFAAAKEGAQRAVDAADRRVESWSDQIKGFIAGYIVQVPYFSSEDLWLAAEKAGIEKPKDRRAYGGIIQGFINRGAIRKVGTGFSKLPHLHGNHITVYERA